MATTNVIKWDDTNNRLTAFCLDDTGETEIGPCKWDDTNNRLEINCNSVDATVKWDDTGNNLESRTTDDGCCVEMVEANCCGNDCATAPGSLKLVLAGLTNCTELYGACEEETDCLSAEDFNGTYILPIYDNSENVCTYYLANTCYCNESYPAYPQRWTAIIYSIPESCGVSVYVRNVELYAFSGVQSTDCDDCDVCDALPVVITNNTNNCIGSEPRYVSGTGTCTISKV